MKRSLPIETTDLRKQPYIKARAIRMAYVHPVPSQMTSTGLPIGTQARFIAASANANALGKPLNTMLTIRWVSLFCDNDVNELRTLSTPDRIDHLVELLRKWLVRNGSASVYIWVRENAYSVGEHWHIAFHVPPKKRGKLVRYIADLTGEPARRRRDRAQQTEGEFACGALSSWHLAHDTHPQRAGYFLAAYLGKGEPSQRLFRGKLTGNAKKPIRGLSFGGNFRDGAYDMEQGEIEGTACRTDRFFISNALKRAARPAIEQPPKLKPHTPLHGKATLSAKL